MPLVVSLLAACGHYQPPVIADGVPRAKVTLESTDKNINLYVNHQGCRPPVLFLASQLLDLKKPVHGINADAAKKQVATRFAADVPANQMLVVIPTKRYFGRTTYSWVKTGAAPALVPNTEVLYCPLPAFNWTAQPHHVYQVFIESTGKNDCDVRAKLLDITVADKPVDINTSEIATTCPQS
ncbi:hypothetical protein [Hydromonas duriensis]|nr:hypothetical protein [Hydromonas duriensis]